MPQTHEIFYRRGFDVVNFDSLGLHKTLQEILEGRLKTGFSLSQKYSSTVDLRPNVIDYSEDFLGALKKNNIKGELRSLTLKDLTLYHVQVRVAESTTSYMDWHRDSYFDHDRQIGMAPPGLKIIYYPTFVKEQEPRLLVSEGSHRTMIDNHVEDLKLIRVLPTRQIIANNDQALIFDTSLLHSVVPDKPNQPSIRLIYSFVAKEQLPQNDPDDLHRITSKRYEEMF